MADLILAVPPQDFQTKQRAALIGRLISHERLRALLSYDPSTGDFTWLVNRRGPVKAGDIAGSRQNMGYHSIKLDGIPYLAHRLAWFFIRGAWPESDIDHVNGIRTDNRIENLRMITRSENLQNQRGPKSNNTSGFLGVSWDKHGRKWVAQITILGKQTYIGSFPTPSLAHEAYLSVKRQSHQGCTI